MADSTAEFFAELARRGHEPLLKKATGTVRFDLEDGKKIERWSVAIHNGDIAVSRRPLTADCTFRANKALFDGVARGEVNAIAALLRGVLAVEGDWRLAVLFQRLFPGPPASAKKRRASRRR
jgi:putative sterol carrier protein